MIKKSKRAIADAYGELLDAEIEAILASAPKEQHIFSDGFEKKMNALINNAGSDEDGCKTEESVPVKRRKVRKLWLIAAAILALAAAACAVPEVRKSIAGFFIKVFGDHVEYSQPEITKTKIEEEYGLTPIPEGFTLDGIDKSDTNLATVYADNDKNYIFLEQCASKTVTVFVDAEHGDFAEYDIEGRIVRIKVTEEYADASWIQDGYLFNLGYGAPVDLDTFKEWIASVKLR